MAIPADTVSIAKQCPYAIEVTTARGDVKIDDELLEKTSVRTVGAILLFTI